MATLNSITRLLKPSKTILFCGAGVSYNSGIPLANQIKYSILCNLDLTEDENKIIISSKLPFELFMQIILFKDDSSMKAKIFLISSEKLIFSYSILSLFCSAVLLNSF